VGDSPAREKLDLTNNQVVKCWEEGGEWWKVRAEDQPDNSSRELSRF
jgi:hypothetical protein